MSRPAWVEKLKRDPSDPDVTEPLEIDKGTILAVKIASDVLGEDIWLVLDRGFIPTDGLATYYTEEILELKTKTPEELRDIHKAKLAFPGCKVVLVAPPCWNCGNLMTETTDIYERELWICWECARTA